MKSSSNRAKFDRIAEALRKRIRQADANDALPSERRLAEEFHTTPMTVRRALEELAEDGLIVQSPRRATRIARRVAPIRVYCGDTASIREVFARHLARQFPGESFDFLEPESLEAVFGHCDIMLAPASVLHDYESHFAPLPSDVLQRVLENPGVGQRMLDLHRRAGCYYGIPILASAGGMQINLALLRELGIEECASFDLPGLVALKPRLARHKDSVALMDRSFYNTLIMHLILMFGPGDSLEDEDWSDAVDKGLEAFFDLFADGSGDFAAGGALLRIVCRQTVVSRAAQEHLPFPVRVIPLPAGSMWSGVPFAQSLLVSRDHPRPARLFEICESFLSSAAQEAIGQTRHGFPMLPAARYASLQHPVQGDDVFAFGLERCCYRQPPLLLQLKPVLWSLLGDMLDGAVTMADAKSAILETSRGLQSHGRAHRRFVEEFGTRNGMLGQVVA
ncbi:MAG: GntR family transcriptional regulator [Kiritimatiellae bacterium]|nr:GntR family transcriptional regulator [Kiritimatiellia bacterium]